MQVEEFVKKMLVKQSNSIFAWIKLGSFFMLPSFVYQFGWWFVLLWFVLLGLLFVFLPPFDIKPNLMSHAMRGVYLEYIGVSEFITPTCQKFFGETWKKVVCIIVALCYMIFTLNYIADKHLILGSLLYYPFMLKVVALLVEYADISKNNTEYIIEDIDDDKDVIDVIEESTKEDEEENIEV